MPHALNLTLPIKQDPETLAQLAKIKATFATDIQPKIENALRKSEIVHFARVVVIHDKFLQVLTEYDGDPTEYTEFFRKALPDVFATLFSLADGAPSFDGLDRLSFFKLAQSLDLPALGESAEGFKDASGQDKGYLFAATRTRTVKEILPKLGEPAQEAGAQPDAEIS